MNFKNLWSALEYGIMTLASLLIEEKAHRDKMEIDNSIENTL